MHTCMHARTHAHLHARTHTQAQFPLVEKAKVLGYYKSSPHYNQYYHIVHFNMSPQGVSLLCLSKHGRECD